MENKLNIENLIAKLKGNNLTSEELSELLTLVRSKIPDNQVESFLSNELKHMSNMNDEVNSELLLAKIHSRLALTDQTLPGVHANRTIRARIFKIVQYAAVLALVFIFSWMAQNAFKKSTQPITNNINSYNEVSVSYGSKSRIVLPDGSVVNLNSGSKIRYSSHFENDRSVFIEGEVFFNVKKDAKHPFYVHTSDITIKVLGTVFNVKSYPEENTIETTLVSGSVQIFDNNEKQADKDKAKQIATLSPNQKALFLKNNREMTTVSNETKVHKTEMEPISPNMIILNKVKTEVTTAWKDNRLVFDNEKFELLLPKLERWYNIEIINDFPEINTSRFTGKFDLETIEQALKALQITTPFNYTMEKNKLTIYK